MTVADAFRAHMRSGDGDIDLARRVIRGVLQLALRELGDDSAAVADAGYPGGSVTGAAPAAEAPTILAVAGAAAAPDAAMKGAAKPAISGQRVERSLVGDVVPYLSTAPAGDGQKPAFSRAPKKVRIVDAAGEDIPLPDEPWEPWPGDAA